MKRAFLCCHLALCFLLICVPQTFAAETNVKPLSREEQEKIYLNTKLPYTDLNTDELRGVAAWMERNDIWMNRAALIPDGTTLLLPILNAQCSRTEFYVMLWKAFGKEEFKVYSIQNTDIDPKSEAGKALNWAYHKGLLGLNPKYRDRNYIERLEITLCLYKLSEEFSESPYNDNPQNLPRDVKKLRQNEKQAIMWIIENKIAELFPDHSFHPTGKLGYCTRGDSAAFLYRFCLWRLDEKKS